jgi:hypothetical protein
VKEEKSAAAGEPNFERRKPAGQFSREEENSTDE